MQEWPVRGSFWGQRKEKLKRQLEEAAAGDSDGDGDGGDGGDAPKAKKKKKKKKNPETSGLSFDAEDE